MAAYVVSARFDSRREREVHDRLGQRLGTLLGQAG